MWSSSIQSRPLYLRVRYFWSPKNGSEGQTIHVGRRRQAVGLRGELIHNTAPGILRDLHSPPCVAMGQVPQQPGPILLTYKYMQLHKCLPEVNNQKFTHPKLQLGVAIGGVAVEAEFVH